MYNIHMPAAINLLSHRDFSRTLVERLLRWSLVYGRYIIVSTEIIVLLAFIYRFSLDRTITDLNEEIEQKSAIVEANLPFENRFRNLQARTIQIGQFIRGQSALLDVLSHLESITPTGIRFTAIKLGNNEIRVSAVANNTSALSTFINQLKQSSILENIVVTKLASKNSGTGESVFDFIADIEEGQ